MEFNRCLLAIRPLLAVPILEPPSLWSLIRRQLIMNGIGQTKHSCLHCDCLLLFRFVGSWNVFHHESSALMCTSRIIERLLLMPFAMIEQRSDEFGVMRPATDDPLVCIIENLNYFNTNSIKIQKRSQMEYSGINPKGAFPTQVAIYTRIFRTILG